MGEGWRESSHWETLSTTRHRSPGCAKIGNKVIVAGGSAGKNWEILQSTEVLDITTRRTSAGGNMASPRSHFSLATIRIEGQERIFALGGSEGNTSPLNSVEEWVEESSTWKEAESLT